MTRYLLSIYQPDGDRPDPPRLAEIAAELHVLNEALKNSGDWVFTGGLHDADAATVVRPRGEELLVTDGPYAEGKEHIGGIWIIDTSDLDSALVWAGRAAQAVGLPIEIRPFQDVEAY
jgi:hypothetical protein